MLLVPRAVARRAEVTSSVPETDVFVVIVAPSFFAILFVMVPATAIAPTPSLERKPVLWMSQFSQGQILLSLFVFYDRGLHGFPPPPSR